MIICEEVICQTCEKVFCCSECREKHEVKTHPTVVQARASSAPSDLLDTEPPICCPICQNRPFVLHATIDSELLSHIALYHLPLSCQKCFQVYKTAEDLLEFSKCIQHNVPCKLEIPDISTLQIKSEPYISAQRSSASSVSTQTSPMVQPEVGADNITPISMINLRWKAKTKTGEDFPSDSISSIKNISSINNSSLRRSIGTDAIPKGKLVRSTSTPLQAEILTRPKEQAFNASGGHVSSIYNSASEPEYSPPLTQAAGTPSKKRAELVNRYQKPRARVKMSIAVTPLRQVMSKSIQKAIVEHGMTNEARVLGYNRKKMFDSNDSTDVSEKSIEMFPLDLRLSPALRRTQSEIIPRKSSLEPPSARPNAPPTTITTDFMLSSTKKVTESIIIKSTSSTESITTNLQKASQSANSIYQSCRSVEIITSTSEALNEVNIEENGFIVESRLSHVTANIPAVTPRIPNLGVVVNKKIIKFETPVMEESKLIEHQSPEERYYTPQSTPVQVKKVTRCQSLESHADVLSEKLYSLQEQSFESNCTDVVPEDEVIKEKKKPEQGRSKLWSLVSSVMRFPSMGSSENNSKLKENMSPNPKSLIRRCASFAGSLVRQASTSETLKRKRTYTADSQALELAHSESKRLRIQGRQPIQRMRCDG